MGPHVQLTIGSIAAMIVVRIVDVIRLLVMQIAAVVVVLVIFVRHFHVDGFDVVAALLLASTAVRSFQHRWHSHCAETNSNIVFIGSTNRHNCSPSNLLGLCLLPWPSSDVRWPPDVDAADDDDVDIDIADDDGLLANDGLPPRPGMPPPPPPTAGDRWCIALPRMSTKLLGDCLCIGGDSSSGTFGGSGDRNCRVSAAAAAAAMAEALAVGSAAL